MKVDVFDVMIVAGFAFSIFSALLFAYAYFRSKVGNATIEQQGKLIEALTGRVDTLTSENTMLQAKSASQESDIKMLSDRNHYLEGLVTGKTELAALNSLMHEMLASLNVIRDGMIANVTTITPRQHQHQHSEGGT